ncbi:MAG: lamin tail domain-containing protein [Candidatus Portnoybacteria bacterium]|nr:lamin tail domain-containing protein [Candidatus Portnoybacteria bacterium]
MSFSRIKIWLTVLAAVFFIWPFRVQGQIVINEIMYDLEDADGDKEWVELYNSGPAEIDLTGWKIDDGPDSDHSLIAPPDNGSRGSLILPPAGYLLLAIDANALANSLTGYDGVIIDTAMKLPNTAATLNLLDQNKNLTASAAYAKEMGAGGNGKTLEWNGSVFKESSLAGGTPGAPNIPAQAKEPEDDLSPAPAGEENGSNASSTETAFSSFKNFSNKIFLSEFLAWPDEGKEWAEIISADSEPVSLAGWQIDDEAEESSGQEIPETVIAPGQILVIELNKNILNNDGDSIRLLWPDEQVVHAVAYEKALKGKSCSRFNKSWLWASPTPAKENKKDAPTQKPKETPPEDKPVLNSLIETAAAIPDQTENNTPKTPEAAPESQPDNNLTAATISFQNPKLIEETKNNESQKTESAFFARIAALIVFASLTASGFIFWKRKNPIDNGKNAG